jgi:hypothetical protein
MILRSPKAGQFTTLWIVLALLLSGCSTSQQTTDDRQQPQDSEKPAKQAQHKPPSELDRLVANPITNEIPNSFFNAVHNQTRTMSGKPGSDYWTQWANYDFDVELVPTDTLIKGSGTITYYNNSPDTLNQLFMELSQNLHKEGVQRNEPQEITGGVNLREIAIDDNPLSQLQSRRDNNGYDVNGTQLYVRPGKSLFPGDSISIQVKWDFKIPQQGASGRMGYSEDNLFYIGYWYPQMRVYDDVIGWMTDPFTGNAEFYHGLANYDVDTTVPGQGRVGTTGELTNAEDVLTDELYDGM